MHSLIWMGTSPKVVGQISIHGLTNKYYSKPNTLFSYFLIYQLINVQS